MRVLALAIALAAAMTAGGTECIPRDDPPWPPGFFHGSDAVFQARWRASDGWGTFVVEQVLRGDVKVNAEVPHRPRPCEVLRDGELFLVSRRCEHGACELWPAGERFTPALLRYLENAHAETHQTVLAKAVRWAAGTIPTKQFRAWVDTIAVKPRGRYDDEFTRDLAGALHELLLELSAEEDLAEIDAELRAFAELAAAFPADLDPNTPEREEHESDVIEALETALAAARD